MNLRISIALAAMTLASPALSKKLCADLSGEARRACLQAEVARSQAETKRINEKNQKIDKAINVICAGRKGADMAATGARTYGTLTGNSAVSSAGTTWEASRKVGSAITRGKDKCPGE